MTTLEINRFQKTLEADLHELQFFIGRREAIAIERAGDEVETMLDASHREFTVRSLEAKTERLKDVRAALQRIKSGTFGFCRECEEEIGMKRLSALPSAALCISCQHDLDSELQPAIRRPIFALAA